MTWTDERVELLKKLWCEGHSASQIAKELGGVTRNAVIGKATRLKLVRHTNLGFRRSTKSRTPRRARAKKPPAITPQAVSVPNRDSLGSCGPASKTVSIAAVAARPPDAPPLDDAPFHLPPDPADPPEPVKRLSVLELDETTCKWPIGDPGLPGFHFCGRRSGEGVPYCEHHCRIAYPEWMQALEAAE